MGATPNAAQLAEVVNTVASLANAIMDGNVGAVANGVNTVLKRLLPLVLGFVGALVGIAGTITKIRKIFQSIGRPEEEITCKFTGAKYDSETQFPEGFDPAAHGMVKA